MVQRIRCFWPVFCLASLLWSFATGDVQAQRVGLLGHRIPAYLQFSDPEYTVTRESTMATITVVRTGEYRESVLVQYATADGTAIAGQDYTSALGVLSIPAGVGFATFNIPILGPARAFTSLQVTLSNPSANAVITGGTATVTLIEDTAIAAGAPPMLSVRPDGQGQVVVTWRPGTWKCVLEKSENTAASAWRQVNGVVTTLDGCNTVTESAAGGCSFYRLRVQ